MQKWCALGNSEAQFSEYFRLHKLQHIRNCMAAELRVMVGLGFPPKPYTQNANNCINSVVKRSKETRSLSLKSIVQLLRSVVKDQEEQVKLSFIGSGEWTIRKEYNQFQERVEQFYHMTQRQRNHLIEKLIHFQWKVLLYPWIDSQLRHKIVCYCTLHFYYWRYICEGCRNFEFFCCNPNTWCSSRKLCGAKFKHCYKFWQQKCLK